MIPNETLGKSYRKGDAFDAVRNRTGTHRDALRRKIMNKLKEQRQNSKMTQAELAAVSGIKLRSIQHYESGARKLDGANLDTLCTLALALGCQLQELIEDDVLRIKLNKTTQKSL